MPKHSVSEAARLAGVSRSHFYKKFIKTGLISVERDKDDKPIIDTAEIMRACGTLKAENRPTTETGQLDTPEKHIQNTALQVEIQLLREQLTASLEDKKWLQGKIDQLTDQLNTTTRLLEHKPAPESPKKRWWLFS